MFMMIADDRMYGSMLLSVSVCLSVPLSVCVSLSLSLYVSLYVCGISLETIHKRKRTRENP